MASHAVRVELQAHHKRMEDVTVPPLGDMARGKAPALLQRLDSTQCPMCTPDPRQLASKVPPRSLPSLFLFNVGAWKGSI